MRLNDLGCVFLALCAVAAHFKPGYHNVKVAISLDLPLDPVEQLTFKLLNFAAAEAGHMHVIALGPPFVKVSVTLGVQQIEFVN